MVTSLLWNSSAIQICIPFSMDSVVAWMRDSVLSLNIPDNMQRIYNVETLYILVYLYERDSIKRRWDKRIMCIDAGILHKALI